MLCRAKVNLTLHVGARIVGGRWEGYHPVESLVAFADIGDVLAFDPADTLGLEIVGPFAGYLALETDNIIHQAMRLVDAPPHRVTLTKNLPVSAGLGGGSANAAGVFRRFDPEMTRNPAALGADVPVCTLSRTTMMEGIGERLTPVPGLGTVDAVLVNPGIPVSTAEIFEAYDSVQRPVEPDRTQRSGSLIERARSGVNDMQNAAVVQAPEIAEVLTALDLSEGCDLARMSGSGASCFGLFRDSASAHGAADALSKLGWWAVACTLGDPD